MPALPQTYTFPLSTSSRSFNAIGECVINRLHVVEKRGRCREERTRRGLQGKTGGEWIKGPTWRLRPSECAGAVWWIRGWHCWLKGLCTLPQSEQEESLTGGGLYGRLVQALCLVPWCAVLHKHTQIHDNPLHGLSKAMNGGHSAYSPCKSGSQRDSVAAVIKESPLFRCLSTFQSFRTRLRHTRWTTSQRIWRQFEIFCMKSCKLHTTNC